MKAVKAREKVLPAWISSHADREPGKVAIVRGAERLTYAALRDRMRALAGALRSLGVDKGDRVALLLKNSPEFIISFFAIADIGAVAVPLNIQYKEQELTGYLKDSRPRAVIAADQAVPLLNSVMSSLGARECAVIGVPGAEDGGRSFPQLLRAEHPAHESLAAPELPALIQYSSGSTGKPKKIIRTQSHLVWEAQNFGSTVHMTGADRILCVVPLFHAHGLGNCMLASAHAGATLVVLEEFNRRKVLRTIQEEGITVYPGVPFMFSILGDTPVQEDVTLSSLRLCFSAGAPLTHQTFQKFYEKYGIYVRQLYGSTETGSVSINLGDYVSETYDSVGLPMNNVQVEIIDEGGRVLPPGETGNVGIKSPAMTGGYAGREDLTRESFRNGFFFPGDTGRKDDRGNLYLTGRKTMFINTGGNKVNPEEVEEVLAAHASVKEVVVVGVKGDYGEEAIKAVVVPEAQVSEVELIEFCKGKIADFKIPRIVEFRDEIPKSPLGKILRKYLC